MPSHLVHFCDSLDALHFPLMWYQHRAGWQVSFHTSEKIKAQEMGYRHQQHQHQ
jgi:hypothetical protein